MPACDPRLQDVVCRIEADDGARHLLWEKWHDQGGTPWKGETAREVVEIVRVDGRPIVISLDYARIHGQRVVFWNPTSQLIDHALIEKWFAENYAPLDPGNHTDVMNFRNAVSRCRRLSGL